MSTTVGTNSYQPQWYATYTRSRHEKSVAEQMRQRSIEHFLPLYNIERLWKNGRAKVQLPLFPGYVFVHIALHNRLNVLQVPGVVRLIGFNDVPVPLPENDIMVIRSALASGIEAEPFPYIKVGTRVRVNSGPLEGLAGILHHKKGKSRLVLSVDLVMQSIAIEVDASQVEAAERDSELRLIQKQMMQFGPVPDKSYDTSLLRS